MQRPELVNKLLDDDTGVSPVIGVILMVAVTVIMAAVIGSSVLGIADGVGETPPKAQFDFEVSEVAVPDGNGQDLASGGGAGGLDDTVEFGSGRTKTYTAVTINHNSGENFDPENIKVTVNGEPAYGVQNPPGNLYEEQYYERVDVITPWDEHGDTVSAGDSTMLVLGTSIIEDEGLSPSENPIYFEHYNKDLVDYGSDGGPYDGDFNELINEGETARLSSGDEVKVIFSSGDSSQTLAEYTVE